MTLAHDILKNMMFQVMPVQIFTWKKVLNSGLFYIFTVHNKKLKAKSKKIQQVLFQ